MCVIGFDWIEFGQEFCLRESCSNASLWSWPEQEVAQGRWSVHKAANQLAQDKPPSQSGNCATKSYNAAIMLLYSCYTAIRCGNMLSTEAAWPEASSRATFSKIWHFQVQVSTNTLWALAFSSLWAFFRHHPSPISSESLTESSQSRTDRKAIETRLRLLLLSRRFALRVTIC